ncbi:MAG TPA: ribose-phosphate pyrophosphokinase [Oligoflexia bacterium]|nr:ribose-phosphate pyrophosphokinase [Oligoflexia bacterium]HMP47946.1 ribose-phosphate pyrophosphokinase [Oligoflexia bacterium]
MRGDLSIIAGRSNPILAASIAKAAGVELTACDLKRFSDGELGVEIRDNVRGHDVFVIQSTSTPANDHLMELLILMDALRRSSAGRVTAVLPYFGYARQDRKTKPRVAITAKLVSDLIVNAGADRVLTMDLHAGQVMGFFNVPVDNLYARPVLLNYLKEHLSDRKITIISPDAGGVARARAYAKRLDAGLAIIDKRRSAPNEIAEMNVVGDVSGTTCVIVDDIIDTGGTMVRAADALLEHGAVEVFALASHAVLSGNAKEIIPDSNIKKLIISDSIFHNDLINIEEHTWLTRISVAPLIGEAIRRINGDESVSVLFSSDEAI